MTLLIMLIAGLMLALGMVAALAYYLSKLFSALDHLTED